LTIIPGNEIHIYLAKLPVEKIWGIGANTSAFLRKFGITTALEFAGYKEDFIKAYLSKPYQEIWHELNGRSVYPVIRESKGDYKSISKTKTFTPPSKDEEFIFAQLTKNLENACIKARRHHLMASRLIIFLRRQDFRDTGIELKLNRPTAYPVEIMGLLKDGFREVYDPDTLYRSTGIVLAGLQSGTSVQYTIFDDVPKIEKMVKIYNAVDEISSRFGKHTIQHASSLPTKLQAQHEGERGDSPLRKNELFKGENRRQRLGLPVLSAKV